MTSPSRDMTEASALETAKGSDGIAEACRFRVTGMDCPSCADDITRALKKLEGVEDVRVDVLGGQVQVKYAEGKLARGDLAGTIQRLGYQVHDDQARRLAFIVEGMDCADEVRQIEAKLGALPGVTRLQFDLMKRRLLVEGGSSDRVRRLERRP